LKLHEQGEDSRSSCHSLFQALGIQKIEGQFGETKIFLKAGMARRPNRSRTHARTHQAAQAVLM
jgi:myosin heavy subunit